MWWFENPTIKTLSQYLLEQARENAAGETLAEEKVTVAAERIGQRMKKGTARLGHLKKRVNK